MVVNIHEEENVKNPARKMAKFGINILQVHGGELIDIITEKDIVQRVVRIRSDPSRINVLNLMSESVIVVGPRENLRKQWI
jgi:predicted transcriptional regulator